MEDLEIQRLPNSENGLVILRLIGALDAHTFEDADNTIQGLFAEGAFKIVLDLEEVRDISSAGVGTLVTSTIQARANGGNLVLIKTSDRLREIFTVLGLSDALQCADDLDPALACF